MKRSDAHVEDGLDEQDQELQRVLGDIEFPGHLEQKLLAVSDRVERRTAFPEKIMQPAYAAMIVAGVILIATVATVGWISWRPTSNPLPPVADTTTETDADPNKQTQLAPDSVEIVKQPPRDDPRTTPDGAPRVDQKPLDREVFDPELAMERMIVQRMLEIELQRQSRTARARASRLRRDRWENSVDSLAATILTAADFQAQHDQSSELAAESYRLVAHRFAESLHAEEATDRLRKLSQ